MDKYKQQMMVQLKEIKKMELIEKSMLSKIQIFVQKKDALNANNVIRDYVKKENGEISKYLASTVRIFLKSPYKTRQPLSHGFKTLVKLQQIESKLINLVQRVLTDIIKRNKIVSDSEYLKINEMLKKGINNILKMENLIDALIKHLSSKDMNLTINV